jgi:hypothetical protein
MKDFRNRKILEHDPEVILGDYVVVPRENRADRLVRRAVLVLFGLLIGFYLWG